jgi:glucose-1-phosphate thymidylyltransferase
MKGVILSGGWGTRMMPATSSTNKHMLPVYTKDGATPMIDFPIKTLKSIGIKNILIITSQDHCGRIVDYLGDGYSRGLDFTYKIQDMKDPSRPAGIASALKLCEDFTEESDFVVALGDNFHEPNPQFKTFFQGCANDKFIKSGLLLYKTDEWSRFGVADIENNIITRIVEKPTEYISDLAVTGLYYYTKDVYNIASRLVPSGRGELEITDINDHYIKTRETNHLVLDTFWSDMGTPESMMKTQTFLNNEQ